MVQFVCGVQVFETWELWKLAVVIQQVRIPVNKDSGIVYAQVEPVVAVA